MAGKTSGTLQERFSQNRKGIIKTSVYQVATQPESFRGWNLTKQIPCRVSRKACKLPLRPHLSLAEERGGINELPGSPTICFFSSADIFNYFLISACETGFEIRTLVWHLSVCVKTEDLGLVINFGTGIMELWLCVKKNSRKKDQTGGRGGPRGVWQKATLFRVFFRNPSLITIYTIFNLCCGQ